MKSRHLVIAAFAGFMLSIQPSLAGEKIELDYQYTGDPGVGLNSMIGGPLTVSAFVDQRDITDKNHINRTNHEAVSLEPAPTELIRQTFVQAFDSAGATLADGEAPLTLSGKLLEMEIEEGADGVAVLIRCELTLNNQGRNAWQSVVFSRVVVAGDDVAAAISQSLDRLVSELFLDDYFLMELGIF
ncbi:MAG: hypothetical protein WD071_06690 [Pseudohongiella sp.]|uniref:hypothetical protein n=1 Tax=Pseudohongiella sp. TaxID=1979412 RepID=UPI0034A08D53